MKKVLKLLLMCALMVGPGVLVNTPVNANDGELKKAKRAYDAESGDMKVARAYERALRQAGHEVPVLLEFRIFFSQLLQNRSAPGLKKRLPHLLERLTLRLQELKANAFDTTHVISVIRLICERDLRNDFASWSAFSRSVKGQPSPLKALFLSMSRMMLESTDPLIRLNGFLGLQELSVVGDREVRVLSEILLKDFHHQVRHAIFNSLKAMGERAEPAMPVLIQLLSKEHGTRMSEAAQTLGRIGAGASDAVPRLLSLLQEVTVLDYKGVVINAIGNIGTHAEEAVPILIAHLNNRELAIRYVSVIALGKFGSDAVEAIPVLISRLEDKARIVRLAVAEALINIDNSLKSALIPEGVRRPGLRHAVASLQSIMLESDKALKQCKKLTSIEIIAFSQEFVERYRATTRRGFMTQRMLLHEIAVSRGWSKKHIKTLTKNSFMNMIRDPYIADMKMFAAILYGQMKKHVRKR